mmetsp:Transcript_10858/g.24634  ORF Transcript_10858/g.24634 Transcript_10858/m.24634 type:complete len:801 (-) Transcript_10858:25-2427(-)
MPAGPIGHLRVPSCWMEVDRRSHRQQKTFLASLRKHADCLVRTRSACNLSLRSSWQSQRGSVTATHSIRSSNFPDDEDYLFEIQEPQKEQAPDNDAASMLAVVDVGVLAKLSTKLKFLRARVSKSSTLNASTRRASMTFETRDKKEMVDAFRALKMAGQAEILRERLPEAMTRMGYRELDEEWLARSLEEVLGVEAVSSFLDFDEFSQVVEAYRTRHLQALEKEFFAYVAGKKSETITVEEVTALLERVGYLMLPGIVRQLLAEASTVIVPKDLGVGDYVYLRQVIQYRGGFTQAEAEALRETFSRWDDDHSDSMSFLELKAALKWQGFCLSYSGDDSDAPETLTKQSSLMDTVTSGIVWTSPDGINFQDYLQVMRKYRELEIGRARQMFGEHANEEDMVDVHGAIHIMQELGYVAATSEVVRDWSAAVGMPDADQFTLDQFYMLFTKVRANEGFTKSELEEISRAFHLHDSNSSRAIDVVELGGVLRWLGYPISIEQQQELMDDVDMDGSGEVDFDELLKVMRWYKEDEYRNLQRAYTEGDLDGSGTLDKREVQHLLPALGYLKLSKEQSSLIDSCFIQNGEIDFEECMTLVQSLRGLSRAEFRATHGYLGQELDKLRTEFNKAAARTGGPGGQICSREIIRLFEAYFPDTAGTVEGRDRAADLLKKVDTNNDGRLSWYEFLHLMRMAQDRAEFDAVNCEEEAAARSGFSRAEVRDLRKAFKLCDTDLSKMLDVHEVLEMLACMRPLTRPVVERITEIVTAADKDNKQALHFPEFLMVMRAVTDEKICDLGSAAQVADH